MRDEQNQLFKSSKHIDEVKKKKEDLHLDPHPGHSGIKQRKYVNDKLNKNEFRMLWKKAVIIPRIISMFQQVFKVYIPLTLWT